MRDQWKFKYSVSAVYNGAVKKLEFHTERLAAWQSKQKEVMEEIKANGLEIDESVMSSYSSSGRNVSVNIRNDFLKDLNECTGKITEHKTKIAVYQGWVSVLSNVAEQHLDLTHEDILFFFSE